MAKSTKTSPTTPKSRPAASTAASKAGRAARRTATSGKAGREAIRAGRRGGAAKRQGPSSRKPTSNGNRAETKQACLLTALRRPQGAGIASLMKITGWQSHSVRAALTGFRNRGIAVTRTKNKSGASIYCAEPA